LKRRKTTKTAELNYWLMLSFATEAKLN